MYCLQLTVLVKPVFKLDVDTVFYETSHSQDLHLN